VRRLRLLLLAAACVLVPAAGASPGAVAVERSGVVVSVGDSGELQVRLDRGGSARIWLPGVVVPARGSCFGTRAAAELRRLALGKAIRLVGAHARAYVELPGGRDLGRLLVAGGFARLDGRGFSRFPRYVPVQHAADVEKRGMWGACAADLAVGMTAPAQAGVGERLEYSATVRNRGPLAAPGVRLELRPSRSMTIVGVSSPGASCEMRAWLALCSLGRLGAGETASATLVVRVERAGSAYARAAAGFDWCVRARCGSTPLHEADPGNDERIALTLVGARFPAVAASGRSARASAPGPDVRGLEAVRFVSVCGFSHRAPDDPIAFPGEPGKSHDHTFFGNVSTSAASTAQSLRSGQTTCQRSGDTAAYWAPTLVDDGKVIVPVDAVVYYTRRTIARVRPFPPGLQVVGGDQHAAAAQPRAVTAWDCGEGTRVTTDVPTCTASRRLRLGVRFPDCWDGRRLATGLAQSHMTYSSRGACPRSHPVAVPSISLFVTYPVRGGRTLGLASGGRLTGHADFVNGWQQRELERLVARCLNAVRVCGRTL
jgi:endonuclease YncB( thermonuclease family)